MLLFAQLHLSPKKKLKTTSNGGKGKGVKQRAFPSSISFHLTAASSASNFQFSTTTD
jgi:hypothetical protein